ncbi:MAG: hypothetical protein AB1443_00950 [Pseudomonadota bacterium]
MSAVTRKKSPRAPSMSLGDAIEKVGRIYDRERCHAAPIDGVAQHIGYKSAANGAALAAMASLKYYGLVDRPREGMIAVSKDFEAFRFAPTEVIKQGLITKWLKSPSVFADLLEKYPESLPSDATLKFDLIQKGFAPAAADVCQQVFRKSVDYAKYFDADQSTLPIVEDSDNPENSEPSSDQATSNAVGQRAPLTKTGSATTVRANIKDDIDRIPVRLAGGRRAWIEVPMPFYEADKDRLKKQIDLLLTDNDDDDDDSL